MQVFNGKTYEVVMTQPALLEPMGFEQIADLSSAVGLTDIPDGAQVALIVAKGQDVSWRDDSDDPLDAPTASVGMHLAKDAPMWYSGDLSKIQFIEQSASATLCVSYYKTKGL
ncbi:MAG TPA: hypothetical protein VIK69_04255 [Methylophilaceae bacterium]